LKVRIFTQLDGTTVAIVASAIIDVQDYPRGQSFVELSNGRFYQVKEDATDIIRWWQEETK
jgi:uncharacterized protein YlzI (FlbEa/FlbD family)